MSVSLDVNERALVGWRYDYYLSHIFDMYALITCAKVRESHAKRLRWSYETKVGFLLEGTVSKRRNRHTAFGNVRINPKAATRRKPRKWLLLSGL